MKDYNERIARLRLRKLAQTQEKIRVEGALDEDDYGRIVPPPGVWHILPNNPDGSFYGYDAWADNFCDLMSVHPVYMHSQGGGCISCPRCDPTNGIRIIRTTI